MTLGSRMRPDDGVYVGPASRDQLVPSVEVYTYLRRQSGTVSSYEGGAHRLLSLVVVKAVKM